MPARRKLSTHEVRSDRGKRRRVPCACQRFDMDHAARCCPQCHKEQRRRYWNAYDAVRRVPVTDFTPEQIEARYQRAVLQRRYEAATGKVAA